MLHRSIAVLLATFGIGCATAGGGTHPDAVKHNDEGAQLLSSGATEDAEARFLLALEFAPDFPEAWANLGIVALSRGDLDKAEEHLQHAVRLNRDFAEAWSSLGVVYEHQGRPEKAIDAYKQSLSIQPGLVDPRRNLAILLLNKNDFALARSHLMKLVQIVPDEVLAQGLLAYCDARLDRFNAAMARAEKILEAHPDEAIALVVRGIVHAHRERWNAAVPDLRRGIDDALVGRAAETRLAAVYAAQGAHKEAWVAIRHLLDTDPDDAAAHLIASWLRLEEGLWREAKSHALSALAQQPDLEQARVALRRACELSGRPRCERDALAELAD